MFKAIGQFFRVIFIAMSSIEDLALTGKAMSNKVLNEQLQEQSLTKDDLLKLL